MSTLRTDDVSDPARVINETCLSLFESMLHHSPLALVAWDGDNRVSYWSSNAVEMFGYTPDDVLGKRTEDFHFIHDDDREEIASIVRRLNAGDTHIETRTNRNYHKNGNVIYCRWYVAFTQENPTYRIISFVENVTDEQAAIAGLEQSEERFRSLFANNPDIIVIFSPDGRIVDVNRAIERYGPMNREDTIGHRFEEFLYEEDVQQHREYIQRALNGEVLRYESRAHTIEGRELELLITTIPIRRNGTIDGLFSLIRDETTERQARRRIIEQEGELLESEQRLRSLFDQNPAAVFSLDDRGTILDVNQSALLISGFAKDQVTGHSLFEFVRNDDQTMVRDRFERARRGERLSFEFRPLLGGGRQLTLQSAFFPAIVDGNIAGIYFFAQDITARRLAERKAREQTRQIRELSLAAASSSSSNAQLIAILEAGCRIFEMECGAIVQHDFEPRVDLRFDRDPADPMPLESVLAAAEAVSQAHEPIATFRSIPGDSAIQRCLGTFVSIDEGPYGILVFLSRDRKDASVPDEHRDLLALTAELSSNGLSLRRSREHLRQLAYTDALTGLANRTLFQERLRESLEVAQSRFTRLAVMVVDLDGFKSVNETLGHGRGDAMLRQISGRLLQASGPDATVARLGGDEFAVLLPSVGDVSQVEPIIARLLHTVENTYRIDEYEQFITASAGIAIYPEDGRDDETLMKNLDIALYRAKERGRNGYVFYHPSLEATVQMRLSQEKLLRRALEREEFIVHYQPISDARTGRIVALEALVRWNHPASGIILPSQFVPSAEISGLIVPLGDWVLRTAAATVAETLADYPYLRLAVNLSAKQLQRPDLVTSVERALAAAKFPPQRLEIEITESVAMVDLEQAMHVVGALKAIGAKVSVDDFGTGYSSLSYLRRFDVDEIKIDRSFVDGIGSESNDETIVRTIIGMGHSLGLKVVAEGVETQQQLDFLREEGCDFIQGFLIARPTDAQSVLALLQREAANG